MTRATATFNGKLIAETDSFQFVEGNVYFPPSSILDNKIFTPSDTTTFCPWKGTASYYNISVDGVEARDAAWYYPMPEGPKTERAAGLKGFVAFCEL
ncbi:MAG: hypothetical protein OHK93_004297 [Ramalina farinacea]|uniref:DUF427 domain-containing protein n=1 Tax=Ramalina farinacea TaxID=258253 RepID=A0AA43TVU6_9LECA|nr:hypothetical protein [Ramalina farinacea]